MKKEAKEQISAAQALKNWAKLGVFIGILPWAYYYVTTLVPLVFGALGIDQSRGIKIGFYIFPIVLPPLVLFSLLSMNDPDE